jgi:hypothetical protein
VQQPETRVRGLEHDLITEFQREEAVTADTLVFCDLITTPDGERGGFGGPDG